MLLVYTNVGYKCLRKNKRSITDRRDNAADIAGDRRVEIGPHQSLGVATGRSADSGGGGVQVRRLIDGTRGGRINDKLISAECAVVGACRLLYPRAPAECQMAAAR